MLVVLGEAINPRLNDRVHALARALAGRPGLLDVAPAYASMLVSFDPLALGSADVEALVREALAALPPRGALPARRRRVPVAYGGAFGPDLPEVARRLGLAEAEVVRLHAGGTCRVYMSGFAPGYSYLGELPERLALPRLATPRPHVAAGSVAIAGRQTGIYGVATPGGWHVLGRTPWVLFDPERDPPCRLSAGDRVRFVPIDATRFGRARAHPPGRRSFDSPPPGDAAVEVIRPGLLTSVQDLGRWGYARYGVPTAGAMDSFAAMAANRLVGNADGAAVLEITLAGPALRFPRGGRIAVAGADLAPQLDSAELAGWTAHEAPAGAVLRFGRRRAGLRAYLAIAGGIDVPAVLGSRSTYLPGGFGGHAGRALQAGDVLGVGSAGADAAPAWGAGQARGVAREPPSPAPATAERMLPTGSRPAYGRDAVIRVVLGPHVDRFSPAGRATLLGAGYRVGPASDRMGYRLHGPRLERREPADILSVGMPLGGIQVPADGQPIVLLADHQTHGGYPLIATVIRADLPLVAQLAPGEAVNFRAVGLDEARAALRAAAAALQTIGARAAP